MHISFIYYTIYIVLFSWLFPYKSPEICQVFSSGVSFFNYMMSLCCCLAASQSLHCWSWFRVSIHLPFSGNTRMHSNHGQLKGIDSSPKNENSVIIYSPSSSSKPVWMSLFCRTQRKIFWRKFVIRLFWGTIDFHSRKKNTMEVNSAPELLCFPHSSEYLPLCSAEQRHSYRFGTIDNKW